MSTETELEALSVKLRKTGELTVTDDGKDTVIARYDRASGHLEFETREYSSKFYNQVTARIGSVNRGTQPSGNVIRSITVKGDPKQEATGGKRPKAGPEGDATPAVVDWYVKNALSEAIVRYGIYTDAAGKPLRKKVNRLVEVTIDDREIRKAPKVPVLEVGQSAEGGLVRREKRLVEVRSAIIARRSTRFEDDPDVLEGLGVEKLEALFLPQEVVGGWNPEDEMEDMP